MVKHLFRYGLVFLLLVAGQASGANCDVTDGPGLDAAPATDSDTGGSIGCSNLFEGGNLLANPGFEDGLTHWTNAGDYGMDLVYPLDAVAHGGDHWVGHNCLWGGEGLQSPEIRQTVSCLPGKTYLLEAWIDLFAQPSGREAALEWFDGEDPGNGASVTVDSTTDLTDGWRKLSGVVIPTGDRLTFTVRTQYNCMEAGGAGCIDDCSVSLLSVPSSADHWKMYR